MDSIKYITENSLALFVLVSLLAFFATLIWKNKQEKPIAAIARFTKVIHIIIAVVYAILWFINGAVPVHQHLITLYRGDEFVFAIQFYYDHITVVYSIVGAIILFLVITFSRYYMHRDEGFKRFFSTVLFFSLGYNLIIFSGNFETLFVGWEVIGLCSFLLIAFFRNRYLPVKNGFKVISIYRLSDFSLILAMWMMHHLTHQNISFTQLEAAQVMSENNSQTGMALFISMMILLAAVSKSAQLPFTSWLPRAMEGPTSSSAVFYGSLAVHIGAFLLLRTWPFWENWVGIKIAIIVIGALTGVVSTLIARRQPTVKTQIAYSSAAQIGIIFIEIALGLHILALIHFAGNAFLRTYQLLVSPSVLNYLVHDQYFHFKPNEARGKNKLLNTLYTLGIKEWNLDKFLYRFLWSPFKLLGSAFKFLNNYISIIILMIIAAGIGYIVFSDTSLSAENLSIVSYISLSIAAILVLSAFSSRESAFTAWTNLVLAQFFLICGIAINTHEVDSLQWAMFGSGVLLAGITGFLSLNRIYKADKDINLDRYHGYVYEQKNTALVFLLSAIGLIGFPITAVCIAVDVFFAHIDAGDYLLMALAGLCFIFIELAAIRIYCRVFLGLHKKLDHPIAFRSS